MSSKSLKKRRERLLEKDPHCHWCNIEVIFFSLKKHQVTPDNYATIDHLNTRYYKRRRQQFSSGQVQTCVLACNKCNWERNEEETQSLSIEELRYRSGYYKRLNQ